MSNSAEITYAIQNDRPSIMIRVSAQEEGKSKPDLREMLSQIQEAIADFQKSPQAKLLPSEEVVVQDIPYSSPPALPKPLPDNKGKGFSQKFSSKANTGAPTSGKSKIKEPQIATIRQNLMERNIPECAFCSTHGIKRLEDLPGGVAWHVIHDHLY